uniref:Dr-family adhesin NFAE-111 n=1 Tax=Escherichia coli TaxID=562 RepID=P94782_ECOLX|nr:Dr-family adhesin NFAE-111 [Escherichia coli]
MKAKKYENKIYNENGGSCQRHGRRIATANDNVLNGVGGADGIRLGTATASGTITNMESCTVNLTIATPDAKMNRAGMQENREITKFKVASNDCPTDTYAVWFKEIDNVANGIAQGKSEYQTRFYLRMASTNGTESQKDISVGNKTGKGLSGKLANGAFEGKITLAQDTTGVPVDVYTYNLMAAVYSQ